MLYYAMPCYAMVSKVWYALRFQCYAMRFLCYAMPWFMLENISIAQLYEGMSKHSQFLDFTVILIQTRLLLANKVSDREHNVNISWIVTQFSRLRYHQKIHHARCETFI